MVPGCDAGNVELMRNAKTKALLLNQQVLEKLGAVKGDATVNFSGKVVRQPDGSLEIRVDALERVEDAQATAQASPQHGSAREHIRYIPFEQMMGTRQEYDEPMITYEGGGAAIER
jgi:hypothetical protein